MKSLTTFLKVLLFLVYIADVTAQDINTGLVAYYQFEDIDGAVTDAVGDHHGINNGVTTGVPGKIGNAFQFTGTGYVKIIEHADITGFDEFTLTAWIKPASLGGHKIILSKVTSGRDFILKLYNNVTEAQFYNSGYLICYGNTPIQINQWVHVIATWKDSQWKLYYNGQLDATRVCTSNCSPRWESSNMYIGSLSASSEKFLGMIDEVRVYNRALTEADAAALYSYDCSGSSTLWAGKGGSDVFLAASGNVGIGTSTPDEKLTVKGTVHAEEIIVDLDVPAPDYVFEKDYNLFSLEETETFIKHNSHLPNFPTALEMEKNGIDVADINMKLLKHIEELTLHIIAQEKRILKMEDQLKEKNLKRN